MQTLHGVMVQSRADVPQNKIEILLFSNLHLLQRVNLVLVSKDFLFLFLLETKFQIRQPRPPKVGGLQA